MSLGVPLLPVRHPQPCGLAGSAAACPRTRRAGGGEKQLEQGSSRRSCPASLPTEHPACPSTGRDHGRGSPHLIPHCWARNKPWHRAGPWGAWGKSHSPWTKAHLAIPSLFQCKP